MVSLFELLRDRHDHSAIIDWSRVHWMTLGRLSPSRGRSTDLRQSAIATGRVHFRVEVLEQKASCSMSCSMKVILGSRHHMRGIFILVSLQSFSPTDESFCLRLRLRLR